ncbi:273_t:CDS:1, partial [Funneliformis caledonium]
DISNTTYAGGCLPVVNYDPPPAISSSPTLPLKKNSQKKKTGKISVASTETKTEVLSQRSVNITDNTDIISKMRSELEEVLKQMDDIN